MDLSLPILDQLIHCKNLLITGMGGGFDVFCGLPIYFEFKKHEIDAQPKLEGTMLFRDALYKVIAKAERISRRTATTIPL